VLLSDADGGAGRAGLAYAAPGAVSTVNAPTSATAAMTVVLRLLIALRPQAVKIHQN
jgi:hypothetical protein